MKQLTREQSAVLSAFTGILCGPFEAMHEYVEKIMGRPVLTHEMGDDEICDQIKEKSREDFLALVHKKRTPYPRPLSSDM